MNPSAHRGADAPQPNGRPGARTAQQKKDPFIVWPRRVLALLVIAACLFAGVDAAHLLGESLSLWHPLRLSTYAPAYRALSEAYAGRLFSADGPAPVTDGGAHTGEAPPAPSVGQRAKDALVAINGAGTGALGQRELNGVVKLNDGAITTYLPEMLDISHQLAKTQELNQFVSEQGKKFVFVMAPHLIDKFDPKLPAGIVDCNNQMADAFLQALAEGGVATMDLRQLMEKDGFDHSGGFFRTDHHWKPETASWAANRVMRELENWGWLEMEGSFPAPEDFVPAYESVTFYGTAAERTGQAFAGAADTLNCIVPAADVQLKYRHYGEGDFGENRHSFEALYRDWQYADYGRVFGPDAYYLYKTMYGEDVLNESAAANTRLTLICDSFGVPFQSFAACYLRQVTAFQGREHPDLAAAVQGSDIVMVLYTPTSLDIRTENQTIFEFR